MVFRRATRGLRTEMRHSSSGLERDRALDSCGFESIDTLLWRISLPRSGVRRNRANGENRLGPAKSAAGVAPRRFSGFTLGIGDRPLVATAPSFARPQCSHRFVADNATCREASRGGCSVGSTRRVHARLAPLVLGSRPASRAPRLERASGRREVCLAKKNTKEPATLAPRNGRT